MFFKCLLVAVCIWGCSALPATKVTTKYEGWNSIFGANSTSLIQLLHFGTKSYYLGINFKATYFQAAQFCGDIHMQLVSVQSREENDQLFKYIRDANRGDNFWSSGSKVLDGKHWIWMGKGQSVEYTNWGTAQPDNPNDHCLELWHSKNIGLLWTDKDCNTLLFFICEKDNTEEYAPDKNASISSWADIYENSYVSPSVPLIHFGKKSYFVGRFYKATFLEAVEICKMIQMHLVTITSEGENTRLYKYIRDTNAGDHFWSSGSRMLDGKMWIWMSTAELVDYTNWLPSRPDNINEQCIQLFLQKDKGLFWNDLGCNDRLFYICEKPRDIYSVDASARRAVSTGYGESVIPCSNQHNTLDSASDNFQLFQIQGKSYHLGIKFKATYSQALEFCNIYQMTLVSITSSLENELLRKLLHQYSEEPTGFWSSGNKLDNKWYWSSGKPIDYFNWAKGEPTGLLNEDCIEIYNNENVSWNDRSCEDRRFFICEWNSVPSSTVHPILKIYVNEEGPFKNTTLFSDGKYYFIQNNDTVKAIPVAIDKSIKQPLEE